MVINFNEIEQIKLDHFKGGSEYVKMIKFVDDRNTIARISIPTNGSIGFHKHECDQEVMYIVSGKGILTEDNMEKEVKEGFSTYCPQGKEHSIKNLEKENLELFVVITKF